MLTFLNEVNLNVWENGSDGGKQERQDKPIVQRGMETRHEIVLILVDENEHL